MLSSSGDAGTLGYAALKCNTVIHTIYNLLYTLHFGLSLLALAVQYPLLFHFFPPPVPLNAVEIT
jgi:hypothetical protein